MSDDPYILSWLSSIEVTTGPTDSTFNPTFNPTHFSDSLPTWQEEGRALATTNPGLQPKAMTTYDTQPPYVRSSFELLRSLPSQEDLVKFSPYLPTSCLTSDELDARFPHPVHSPLANSVFEKTSSSQELKVVAKYHCLLDIREGLRVEEVVLETRMDRDRLYLNPAMYYAAEEGLERVRVLIMRACESLFYIEKECARRRVELDTFGIDQHRAARRPPEHPFNMIINYLKFGSAFNNFQAYCPGKQLEVSEASEMWNTCSFYAPSVSSSAFDNFQAYCPGKQLEVPEASERWNTCSFYAPPASSNHGWIPNPSIFPYHRTYQKASPVRPTSAPGLRTVERGGSCSASESECSASVTSDSSESTDGSVTS